MQTDYFSDIRFDFAFHPLHAHRRRTERPQRLPDVDRLES